MERTMKIREGVSLLELLAALTLGGIVTAVLGGALVAQLRLARLSAERVAAAEAIRTVTAVLQGELRRATAVDVRAAGSDSLAVRSFRGIGRICDAGSDWLHILYRGDRLPDARKDSLLLLDGSGNARTVPLSEVRYQAAACPPVSGETPLLLRVSATAAQRGVALPFESGTYYLSARALRYRLGAEGRQPLTAELFDMRATRFGAAPHGVRLHLHAPGGVPVTGVAAWLRLP
jgi:hypothetical protein